MPRRFFSQAMQIQHRLADRADRAPRPASPSQPRTDDREELLPSLSADRLREVTTRYAEGTVHKGTIKGRRGDNLEVSFGDFSGLLPASACHGINIQFGKTNIRVVITSFNGRSAPTLKRFKQAA